MFAPVAEELQPAWRELASRALPSGGFAGISAGGERPDATAWAVLALRLARLEPALAQLAPLAQLATIAERGADRLAAQQAADGSLAISPYHPGGYWPTQLAILAWKGAERHAEASRRAVEFLLTHSGLHFPRPEESVTPDDTSLLGWPWIARTHSWTEPTALGLLALRAAGRGEHQRAAEARRLLLDRQLPAGGWNYGNRAVFGRELPPVPENTGVALAALAGAVEESAIAASLDYLERELPRIRTPFALGWGLLGVAAWRPAARERQAWIAATCARQEVLGPFATADLGLLLAASVAPMGLLAALDDEGSAR